MPHKTKYQNALDDLQAFCDAKAKGPVQAAKIAKDIQNVIDKQGGTQLTFLEKYGAKFARQDLQGFLDRVMVLWNATPIPSKGGKTPDQLARQYRKKGASLDDESTRWVELQPNIMALRDAFQAEVFEAFRELDKRGRNSALDGLHLLFFRFWHTSLPELPHGVSPAIAIREECDFRGIEMPKGAQLVARLFRNPDAPKDEKVNQRFYCGIEQDSEAPLARAVLHSTNDQFWADWYFGNLTKNVNAKLAKLPRKDKTPGKAAAAMLACALDDWYRRDQAVNQAFTKRSWRLFWAEMLQMEPDTDGWIGVDDIFDLLQRRISGGTTLDLSGYTAANNVYERGEEMDLGAADMDMDQFYGMMAMFYTSCYFFTYFVVPLGLYTPVIEPYYIEPMDVYQELTEAKDSGMDFATSVAKPPAAFRFTPYGEIVKGELIAGLRDYEVAKV